MTRYEEEESGCSVPRFERLKYFYGRMLGVADLKTEQDFFREKLKLHNRCLHGYGAICGLKVVPQPEEAECPQPEAERRAALEKERAEVNAAIEVAHTNADAAAEAAARTRLEELTRELSTLPKVRLREKPACVVLECGLALDCEGNELVVRRPIPIDLVASLSQDDAARYKRGETPLYVSICYCEHPVEPVRPVLADTCGVVPDCEYGKLRDGLQIHVTIDPPPADDRCETCCEPCADPCLLLARIDRLKPGEPVTEGLIQNDVRRLISKYPFTVVTGVNWVHGASYGVPDAAEILGTNKPGKGLVIEFSRPVLAETIRPGVLDVWVIEGGAGRAADFYYVQAQFEDLIGRTVKRIRYRQTSKEPVNDGDRVFITLRSAFILDECCRPVDGTNTGGMTPLLPGFERQGVEERRTPCSAPPGRYGPWTSGNGIAPGQSFESWFFVKEGD
jgi:hypothetical protein